MSVRKTSLVIKEEINTVRKEPDNYEIQVADNFFVTCRRKEPFTKKQIENIEKYFGFKVRKI